MLFDYAADGPDRLSVQEGDALRVLEDKVDWLWVENSSGATGWVPANYVRTESGDASVELARVRGLLRSTDAAVLAVREHFLSSLC